MSTDWKYIAEHLGLDPRPEFAAACRFVVLVKTEFIEALLKDTDRDIAPGGEIKDGKRQGAIDFMTARAATPWEISAPILRVSFGETETMYSGTLKDGRHRFRVLADMGCEWVSCCVMHTVARVLIERGIARPQERRTVTVTPQQEQGK